MGMHSTPTKLFLLMACMYQVFLPCSLKVFEWSALCKQQDVLLLNPVITESDKICVWVGGTGLCLNSSTMFVEDLFMLKAQWSCSVPCKEGEALKKALDEFEEGLKMGFHCVHYFVFWVGSLCSFLSHCHLRIASENSTEAQEMHKVYDFSYGLQLHSLHCVIFHSVVVEIEKLWQISHVCVISSHCVDLGEG